MPPPNTSNSDIAQSPSSKPQNADEIQAFYFIDLFAEVGRLMAHNYDTRSGLSRNQTRIIIALLQSDGRTQTDLTNELGIHKVSTGIYISELEELGLVERKPHPQDGRAKCIFLTKKLHDLRGSGNEIVKELHKGIIEGMSNTDYQNLLSYMRMMQSNLEKMSPSDAAEKDQSDSPP